MKTYQALAILLMARQDEKANKPRVAQAIKDILTLFQPVGLDGQFSVNYDGSQKPSKKISLEFTSRPQADRHYCFAKADGRLHGCVDITPDLASGCTFKVVGCGSREINGLAEIEASRVLYMELPEEISDIVTHIGLAGGLVW